MPAQEYLRRILNARVYDVAEETLLELAPQLSARLANRVLLKREDLQPVFSFKLRGAYNKMVNLLPSQRKRGVIAASAGNHAQGVALAAAKLGCKAVIVMPVTTPQVKIDAVRARGAEVVLHGDSYSDAYDHALVVQKKKGLTFVHPFDDPDVIAGQGTIGMEILRQHHFHHGAAMLLHRVDLDRRRRRRHHDHRAATELPRRQRDALGMVAGRGTDDAALPLRRRQVDDLVVGAAQLEAEHRLHVLALEQDAVAAARRQIGCEVERSFDRHVIDAGVEDLFEVVHGAERGVNG